MADSDKEQKILRSLSMAQATGSGSVSIQFGQESVQRRVTNQLYDEIREIHRVRDAPPEALNPERWSQEAIANSIVSANDAIPRSPPPPPSQGTEDEFDVAFARMIRGARPPGTESAFAATPADLRQKALESAFFAAAFASLAGHRRRALADIGISDDDDDDLSHLVAVQQPSSPGPFSNLISAMTGRPTTTGRLFVNSTPPRSTSDMRRIRNPIWTPEEHSILRRLANDSSSASGTDQSIGDMPQFRDLSPEEISRLPPPFSDGTVRMEHTTRSGGMESISMGGFIEDLNPFPGMTWTPPSPPTPSAFGTPPSGGTPPPGLSFLAMMGLIPKNYHGIKSGEPKDHPGYGYCPMLYSNYPGLGDSQPGRTLFGPGHGTHSKPFKGNPASFPGVSLHSREDWESFHNSFTFYPAAGAPEDLDDVFGVPYWQREYIFALCKPRDPETMIFYSSEELIQMFLTYQDFIDPKDDKKRFSRIQINRLVFLLVHLKGNDSLLEVVSGLLNAQNDLAAHGKRLSTHLGFKDCLELMMECGMYMRGWNGVGEYPTTSEAAYGQEVDMPKLSRSLWKLKTKLESDWLALATLPLFEYHNGQVIPDRECSTLADRLELIMRPDRPTSCIRHSSNVLCVTPWHYLSELFNEPPFDLRRFSKLD